MPSPALWLALSAALLLSACAGQPATPEPLPRVPAPGLSLATAAASQAIDLSQPLSADAVAAIAVFTNPDLIALRSGEGVAEAQVFAARLYPDPTFSAGFDVPTNGVNTSTAFALGLGFDFAALARRPSAMRGAQANLEAVRFDIAWSEWLTGEQARLLATRIAHLHDIKALTSQLRTIADEEVARALPAVARGDLPATALDSSRLAAADAAERDRGAELQLRNAELELNRVLGLDPAQQLRLAPAALPLARIPDRARLEQAVVARADLAALRAAYQGSAAAIDAANLGRYPFPALGINAARDTSDVKSIGPSVSFTLPIWNRGQGDIALAHAGQEQLRATYIVRLARVRADLAAASENLAITRLQRADVGRELVPLQPLVEASYRAAARGDLALSAANAARLTLLDKQLVEAALTLAIAELEIALEIAAGRPLETIQ